jgi:hypothetical protein
MKIGNAQVRELSPHKRNTINRWPAQHNAAAAVALPLSSRHIERDATIAAHGRPANRVRCSAVFVDIDQSRP